MLLVGGTAAIFLGALVALIGTLFFDYREWLCVSVLEPIVRLARELVGTEEVEPGRDREVHQTTMPCPPGIVRTSEDMGQLAVVACHFNPAGWSATTSNYLWFLEEMRRNKHAVFTCEVAFPGQSFASADAYLQIRAPRDCIMWQKERLLNRIVETLPAHYQTIALVDADLLLLNPNWAEQSLDLLRTTPALQLFDCMYRLDRFGRVATAFAGWDRGASRGLSPWIGGAWVVRRSVFPLYDRCILGGGDTATIEGWLGLQRTWFQRQLSVHERAYYSAWAACAVQRTGGKVGSVSGDCVHLYHGRSQKREYSRRHAATRAFRFDPGTHVRINEAGLLQWTEQSPPGLRAFAERYFFLRIEDGDGSIAERARPAA